MRIQSSKFLQLLLILVVTGLLIIVLIACSTSEPTRAPIPTRSASPTTTDTPAPPTSTPKPGEGEEVESLILPSATPAPTITPNVIGALVNEYIAAKGLQAKTFLGIRVDAWIDLSVSVLLILVIGILLARLFYFGLKQAVLKTKNQYAELFVEQIRSQIMAMILVFGFQTATVRLSILDALEKRWLNQIYMSIYVVIATVILWRLLDALVEWYQKEVEPKRDRHQIEIGIGYGQDIEQVRKILVDTVRQVEGVWPDKPVDALYVEMGPSAMIFRVRWWILSYVDTRRMFDRVNTALQAALDEAGIKTPFNTLDINILNMPGVLHKNAQPGETVE